MHGNKLDQFIKICSHFVDRDKKTDIGSVQPFENRAHAHAPIRLLDRIPFPFYIENLGNPNAFDLRMRGNGHYAGSNGFRLLGNVLKHTRKCRNIDRKPPETLRLMRKQRHQCSFAGSSRTDKYGRQVRIAYAVFEGAHYFVDDEITTGHVQRNLAEARSEGVPYASRHLVFLSLLLQPLLFFHFLSLSFTLQEQYLTLLAEKAKRADRHVRPKNTESCPKACFSGEHASGPGIAGAAWSVSLTRRTGCRCTWERASGRDRRGLRARRRRRAACP